MKKRIEAETDIKILDLTPENISEYGVCGYKNVEKHLELRRKIDWFGQYYQKGLRIKVVIHEEGGYQGMLEYIPGEFAHRPVEAQGYVFIHCLFAGFKKEYKGRGFASALIEECIEEARDQGKDGVAVVTRKGSFMAKKDIFLKHRFALVDKAKPDFELLALKFTEEARDPQFRDMEAALEKYNNGLYVIRSVQCPYTEKNVNGIVESAASKFDLEPEVIDLKDFKEAQNSPLPVRDFLPHLRWGNYQPPSY